MLTRRTRLNGYVAGRGSLAQLRGEADSFGLSAQARAHLERLVEQRAS